MTYRTASGRSSRRTPSLLAGIAGFAAALGSSAMGQMTVGPNVNISRMSGNQAEGAIAINPANPQNLFALYNNLGAGSAQYGAVSTNGGLTWAARPVGTGSDGLTASIGDPTVAFDNFGNLFLGHLTSPNVGTQIGLSINGGASFTALATPWASGTDQPTITAGNGEVWLSVNQGGGNNCWRAAVTGLGLVGAGSISGILPSSNSGTNGEFGDVAIGPGGRVAIIYQNSGSGSGPDTLFMNLDPDGVGASAFGARTTVTTTNVGAFDFIPAQANRSVDAEAGLAYDNTGGPHNGRLYLVYTDETVNENNDMDIRFRFSDNNGATWSPFVRLNDDATTRSQFLPKLAIDPVTGHLAVIWYDARNSASNNTAQIWGTVSRDNGATWAPNVQISAGTSTASVGGGFDYGDYTGLAYYNDVFYPLWADSSNSTGDNPNGTTAMEIYTAKVTVSGGCYANCDGSTAPPILNVNDFSCFLTKYASGDPYANCDASTTAPVLNVNDFSCFLTKYAAGCP
jgi:hypothetical protein